jgi:hypothetical protein
VLRGSPRPGGSLRQAGHPSFLDEASFQEIEALLEFGQARLDLSLKPSIFLPRTSAT